MRNLWDLLSLGIVVLHACLILAGTTWMVEKYSWHPAWFCFAAFMMLFGAHFLQQTGSKGGSNGKAHEDHPPQG